MNRDEHIDNVWLTKIRPLLMEASDMIEALKPGEKIPATELAKQVAACHGMTGPQFYPLLTYIIKGYPNRVIKRGAHGGIENPLATATNKDTKTGGQ